MSLFSPVRVAAGSADHPERHDQHDRNRHRPATAQRGEAEEHEQQRHGVERRRLATRQAFLIAEAGPFEVVPDGGRSWIAAIAAMAVPNE